MTGYQSEAAVQGLGTLALLYSQPSWILRRSEWVSFEDSLTVRRHSELDISLDGFKGHAGHVPRLGNRVLLPIMQVRRDLNTEIRVMSASSDPMPFLPRRRERGLLACGLLELLRHVHRESPPQAEARLPWVDGFDRVLAAIDGAVSEPPPVHDDMPELHTYLMDLAKYNVVVASIAEEPSAGDSGVGFVRILESHYEPASASRKKGFDVPLSRNGYDRDDTRHRLAFAGHHYERPAGWQPLWRRQFRLDDSTVTLPALLLDTAESFHLRAVCPPGLYVERATLVSTIEQEGSLEVLEILRDDGHWTEAHVSYRAALHSGGDPRSGGSLQEGFLSTRKEAALLLVLRPMYHGLTRTGQNVSVVTSALLWVLTFTLGWRSADWNWRLATLSQEVATDPVVAVVLLAPTAALAMIVRQNENLMTKFVADGFRRRIGAQALLAFAAATATAVGLVGPALFWLLLTLSLTSTVLSVITLLECRHSESKVTGHPALPRWAKTFR